jgi:hypothetical protein
MDMLLEIATEIFHRALKRLHGTWRERAESISRSEVFRMKLEQLEVFDPANAFI